MKKEVIVLFLLGMLLISPLALAQEQTQTYSGFNRFIDNVKIFFSFGDEKVMLSLDIREKELNSAITNTRNGDKEEAEKNLERARKRLQFVQNKVSKDIAEDIKINTDKTINKINKEENWLDNFEIYILEEEKTQLTAELVSKVDEKEGQTLTRKIVKDSGGGENKVEIVVGGDKQTEIMEIEEKIMEIDIQIVEKTIEAIEKQVDIPPKTKDSEDVFPAPNVVDDDLAPGPEGIIGYRVIEPIEENAPSDSIDNSEEDNGGDSGNPASITGGVVENFKEESVGPSAEKIKCLEECIVVGCEYGDEDCMIANSKKCEQECGVEPEPEPADEGEACMQECIKRGCDNFDSLCKKNNKEKCEQECNMIGEPEAQNKEEQCIRDCINKIDPNIECFSGTFEGAGETGNSICQECAKSCEYLYAGPCLSDEEWAEKENECYAQCEHCYGIPVMGPSGQGYECTVDITCADASAEFGDDAGTGEDSWESGHAPSENQVYWDDYETTLDISSSEGTLLIENNEVEEKIEVNIRIDKGLSLEQKDEELIIKSEGFQIKVNNKLDELIISKNGVKREIENIDINIEENKLVYKYEEKERAKLLGFISIKKNVKKRVDAENMEMLEEKGPWWEFLLTEEKEN